MPRFVVPMLVTIQAATKDVAVEKAESLVAELKNDNATTRLAKDLDLVNAAADLEEIATEREWKQRLLAGE
jgi:hypothetical protein